jgi:hypothetical protein
MRLHCEIEWAVFRFGEVCHCTHLHSQSPSKLTDKLWEMIKAPSIDMQADQPQLKALETTIVHTIINDESQFKVGNSFEGYSRNNADFDTIIT